MKTIKRFHLYAFALSGVVLIFLSSGKFLQAESASILTENSLTDADGNKYATVAIGNQVWMAENLRTTKLNDGTDIPNVSYRADWASLSTPAYCWYDNDEANGHTYGNLYNWFAVETGKLCPEGWRVPSDDDFTRLANSLRGNSASGGKLKETGTTRWESPNEGATNETGFSFLPGGFKHEGGSGFIHLGKYGYMWTSTEHPENSTSAYRRGMQYNDTHLRSKSSGTDKRTGYSIRCVKND